MKKGAFRSADSGYRPKLGDIVMYRESSPFGHHTNFVLEEKDGVLTTVGGNEEGKIAVTRHRRGPELAIIGFGVR